MTCILDTPKVVIYEDSIAVRGLIYFDFPLPFFPHLPPFTHLPFTVYRLPFTVSHFPFTPFLAFERLSSVANEPTMSK